MAKRKTRKRSKRGSKAVKEVLKYELYGIIIIALSVISLSREGSVSRALTYMFRFLVGEMDFVIPVGAVYVGLYCMVKRAWPNDWTARKTGILCLLLGFVLMNHMSMFEALDPNEDFRMPSYILGETWRTMTEGLSLSHNGTSILQNNIGGGITGALLYALLYFLFGNLGSSLLVWTLFGIGILLVTGVSAVDVLGRLRGGASSVNKGFRHRLAELFGGKRAKPARAAAKSRVYVPEDDSDLEEGYMSMPRQPRKKPAFFQLLQSHKQADDEEDGEPEVLVSPVGGTGAPGAAEEAFGYSATADEDAAIPVVRDFQDHIDPLPEEPAAQQAKGAASAPKPENEHGDPGDMALSLEAKKPERPYVLPSLSLLSRPAGNSKASDALDFKANARKLEATMESFGVRAKVLEVVRGPAVTRYEIQPDVGVKVSRIVGLTDDIALALAAKDIRMEAPIPGKSAIGIEVPNTEVSVVTLREVMENGAFQDSPSKLTITLGRDISGQPIVANLAKMPHLLVAGATGSGKSVCINGIITSILYKAKPDEVKLLMVDPKMVELNVYNGIPHLLAPVVTDPRRASLALKKIVVEMEKRYELFSKSGTRNMEGYNAMVTDPSNPNPQEPLPYIVVIVDELADLMMVAAGDVEDAICRLAQMARAAGIHLIIATQRPSVDVITGVIKANIPSRIAFGVSSQVDSRTILDMVGAEKLLGRGDMLFLPVGASKPIRVQGAFLSDQEVEHVVNYCRNQGQAEYKEDLVPELDEQEDEAENDLDELYDQAVQIVVEAKQASVSLLQRRMRVGYTRAARLIDTMEAKGVVGPYEGSKPREVLISQEMYFGQNRSG
ncbi:DNA translocase FtsK [Paenibacillus sp. YN15]|uniref:FtsK/SpoIIIE family DNA translocase n=1 Tax=Paenibacillus sp. YN15 TaxID=1742774 RepID=UPI000DCCE431|nr:DNA translocase FtsK [Paenibacillus sp. YN15]RAV03579.1 DNA translocase FtsK [Paenibacillus sp. YN15]